MSTEVDITKLINFGNLSFYDNKIKSYIAAELAKKADIDTNTTYQLIVEDNKLQLQKKEINAADWENVGSPLSLGGDYSLELKEDGKLYLINEVTGEESVVELPGDISQGEAKGTLTSGVNARAISQGSTAMGVDVTAGSKAFYIEAINHIPATGDNLATGTIYLRTTDTLPDDGSPRRAILGTGTSHEDFTMTIGYAVGDEFSIIRSVTNIADHFAFCGTITAIQGNMISYECYIMGGELVRNGENWTPKTKCATMTDWATRPGSEDRVDWADSIFWVPKKPEVGFTITNTSGVLEFLDSIYEDLTITNNVIHNTSELYWGLMDENSTITIASIEPWSSLNLNNLLESGAISLSQTYIMSNNDPIAKLYFQTTELFQGTNVFGDTNYGSADSAFLAGEENVSGGNGATIFGTRNRGAYGNLISGGDNVSSGLHSAVLGRYNINLGDYNFVFNTLNTVKSSSNYNLVGSYGSVLTGDYNAIFGKSTIVNGNYNIFSGEGDTELKLEGDSNAVFGKKLATHGNYNITAGFNHNVAGHCNAVFGKALKITGGYNIVAGEDNSGTNIVNGSHNAGFGRNNTIYGSYHLVSGMGNKVKFKDNESTAIYYNVLLGQSLTSYARNVMLIGSNLTTSYDHQVMVGHNTTAENNDAFIVGYDGAKFTVPRTGIPSKSSDAITYGYLQDALLNGAW